MTTRTDQIHADRLEHTIGRDGLFVLNLRDGELRLRGVDGDTARVRSTDGRSLDGLDIETGDRSLSIKAGGGGLEIAFGRHRSNRSPELDIEIPYGTTVVVEGASADIDIVGLTGDQRYRTASGDLLMHGVRGALAIEGVSGDVDIVADGPTTVNVRTVSGDLALRAGVIGSLKAVTTSGDVRIAGRFAGPGPFSVETVSGDAVIAPADGLRIELKTITGDVRSDMDARLDDGPDGRALIVGSGGPTLRFRSTSGDLRVVRAGELPMPPAPPTALTPPTQPTAPTPPTPPGASTAGAADFDDRTDADASTPDPEATPAEPTFEAAPDAHLDILRALERGEIDVAEASDRLAALEDPTDA